MAGAGGILCYNPRHARDIHLALALRRRHIAGRGLHPGYADVDAYLNNGRRYTDPYGLPGRHANAHCDRNPFTHRYRYTARRRWPGG